MQEDPGLFRNEPGIGSSGVSPSICMGFRLPLSSMVKRENVRPLREVHQDRVLRAFRLVVRRQLGAKPTRLHAHQRIELGIEIRWPPEHFGGNLVLLHSGAGMIQRLLGEILKKLAQRFRAMERLAIDQLLYLTQKLSTFCHNNPVTLLSQESSRPRMLLQDRALSPVTVFNRLRLLV